MRSTDIVRRRLLRFAIHSADTLISRDTESAGFWDSGSWKPNKSIAMPSDEDRHWWYRECDAEFDRGTCIEKALYAHKVERGVELREIKTGKTVRQLDAKGKTIATAFPPPEIA